MLWAFIFAVVDDDDDDDDDDDGGDDDEGSDGDDGVAHALAFALAADVAALAVANELFSEITRLAAITTKAIIPPSFILSFQNGLRLNTLPRKRIIGKASIGKRIISGANSINSLST